jgi:plastocyanin
MTHQFGLCRLRSPSLAFQKRSVLTVFDTKELTMKRVLLSAALTALLSATATAEDWGTISGQIIVKGDAPKPELLHKQGAEVKDREVCAAADTYKDDIVINSENGGLVNAFVYMPKKPSTVHPDAEKDATKTVIFDQKNCQFRPHAMVLMAGQSVEVISSDPIAHNTHTYPLKNLAVNILIGPNTKAGDGQNVDLRSPETLPFKVTCDFHPWMGAYWLVTDHPYAAVTDKDGKFEIPNLPPGEHTFRIWHERVGYIDRKYVVEVKAGENVLKPVEVDGADLAK